MKKQENHLLDVFNEDTFKLIALLPSYHQALIYRGLKVLTSNLNKEK